MDKVLEMFEQQGSPLCTHRQAITFAETRQLVGAAFGGHTADRGAALPREMLRPLNVTSDDRTKDRQALTAFCMGFFAFELLQHGGAAVGYRSTVTASSDSNPLRAVIVFREFNPGNEPYIPPNDKNWFQKTMDYLSNVQAYLSMKFDGLGLPEVLSDKSQEQALFESMSRFGRLQDDSQQWHRKYGPPEPHWYIGLVASDPETQGMGYCKLIMTLLCRAADDCGRRCYLECAPTRRTYYEQFGFEVTQQCTIRIGEGEAEVTLPALLMTRPLRRSTASFTR